MKKEPLEFSLWGVLAPFSQERVQPVAMGLNNSVPTFDWSQSLGDLCWDSWFQSGFGMWQQKLLRAPPLKSLLLPSPPSSPRPE